MTPVGLEPTIPGSVGRCLVHSHCATLLLKAVLRRPQSENCTSIGLRSPGSFKFDLSLLCFLLSSISNINDMWQRCTLPLDHWCHWLWEQVDLKFTAGNCACVQTPWLTLSRVQASCLTPSTSQARGYFTVSQVPMATPLQKWCSLPLPSSSTPVPKCPH